MPSEHARRQRIAAGLVIARIRSRLTQPQIADRAGISDSALRHRERGRRSVRLEEVVGLAWALDVPVIVLLADLLGAHHLRCPQCGETLAEQEALGPERQTPGPMAGLPDDGSAMGEHSTVCDSRGVASHQQSTAHSEPA